MQPRVLACTPWARARARRCNERAWCATRPKDQKDGGQTVCMCAGYFKGESCQEHDTKDCYLGCSGRGKCIGGYCHCDPGFWGLGCARSKAYSSPEGEAAADGAGQEQCTAGI